MLLVRSPGNLGYTLYLAKHCIANSLYCFTSDTIPCRLIFDGNFIWLFGGMVLELLFILPVN